MEGRHNRSKEKVSRKDKRVSDASAKSQRMSSITWMPGLEEHCETLDNLEELAMLRTAAIVTYNAEASLVRGRMEPSLYIIILKILNRNTKHK